MLLFWCLLIQDFTHFSQKEALLKQKAFMVAPDQSNLAVTLYHHLVESNVNCMGELTGRKGFASEIPKYTSKANTG